MAMLTTVLFDLDGTLLDSVRLILDSYHHTLAIHGLEPRPDDHWLAGLGTPLMVQFQPWSDDPVRLDAMIQTYREYNIANHDARVTAYPGVVDMVRRIHAAGFRTGLVTSKNRTGAERGLRRMALMDAVDVIVGVEEVEQAKPHPEPVQLALRRLDARADRAIFVGDSVHDMQSGRAAGVRTGAVLWGPFGREHLAATAPDHWLERPDQLLALLGVR